MSTNSALNLTHLQNTQIYFLSNKLCRSEDLASHKKESTAKMLFFFEENKNKQNAYLFPDNPGSLKGGLNSARVQRRQQQYGSNRIIETLLNSANKTKAARNRGKNKTPT